MRAARPLARSSPLEKQRAGLEATLAQYQHSLLFQAMANPCFSMRCSIMSKHAATRLRRICSNKVRTSGLSRSYWGIRTSTRPCCIPMCCNVAPGEPGVRSMGSKPACMEAYTRRPQQGVTRTGALPLVYQ
jgi:hypothetical protein